MPHKQYKASWAKIGNASGFRVSADFFKDNPQFDGAKGAIEVVGSDTLLFRLQPQSVEEEQVEDELMLSLFLDFLLKQALSNADEVEVYTEAMAALDDELIAGVILDS